MPPFVNLIPEIWKQLEIPEGSDGISSFLSSYMSAKQNSANTKADKENTRIDALNQVTDQQHADAGTSPTSEPVPRVQAKTPNDFISRLGRGYFGGRAQEQQYSDPFFQMKNLTAQTHLQGEMLKNKMQMMQLQGTAQDQQAMSSVMSSLEKDPNSITDLNPIFKTPQYQAIWGGVVDTYSKMSLNKARTANAALFRSTAAKHASNPEFSTLMETVDESGNPTPESWRILGTMRDASNKPQSTFGKILFDRDAAKKSGDLEQVALYDAAISKYGAKEGLSIQFDDEGRPIINYGQNVTNVGKPTVATQSQSQRKLLKYEAATELINHLQKNMEDSHVGISGLLGENIGDRLLPQFGIDTFKGKRADVRSTMVAARESLLREISDDTRFSNADREEISKALPSSGAFESLPDAQQRLSTVRRIISQRGRVYSESLGLNPPLWSLSKEEIKAMYEQNQADPKKGIDYNTALEALQRFH